MAIDIGIPADDRRKIADGLSRLLADSYTLCLKTHNDHRNVTGPPFNTLHTMFEEQYTELATAVDEPTADLLTQCMQLHEKNAWMLRSMLES